MGLLAMVAAPHPIDFDYDHELMSAVNQMWHCVLLVVGAVVHGFSFFQPGRNGRGHMFKSFSPQAL